MKWAETSFEELYAIPSKNGLNRPAKVRGSGHKMINMSELFANDRIGRIDMELVPMNTHELTSMLVEPGDLLFARQSLILAGAGKCALVTEIAEPTTFESHIIRVRLRKEVADPVFYHYYFKSPVCRIRSIVTQGVQAGIRGNDLKKLRVHVPPITEQRRIASILSAYDDLIENNQRRIALLEEAARLLYREWFVHFRFPGHEHVKIINGLPEGWEQRTLGDVVDMIKENVKPSDFEEDDIYIGLEHIPRRSFTLANWESNAGIASGKWRFNEGDILFCKIRPYFHKVGFALRRGLVSLDALVWRVHDQTDWPVILCATSSDHFVAVASKTVREGSKMPRADWKVLQQYEILKPVGGLLNTFNDAVRPIAEQCKALALQTRTLKEARDLLLPRLMNGEISV